VESFIELFVHPQRLAAREVRNGAGSYLREAREPQPLITVVNNPFTR